MARTKQRARRSTGGKARVKVLASRAARRGPPPVMDGRTHLGYYSSARLKNKEVRSGVRNKPGVRVIKGKKSNRYINVLQWDKYGKSSKSDKSKHEKAQSKRAARKKAFAQRTKG